MSEFPEGAIKTRDDLKGLLDGCHHIVFVVVGDGRFIRRLIDDESYIDKHSLNYKPVDGKQSRSVNLTCLGLKGRTVHLFTNYWNAYAYCVKNGWGIVFYD